MGCFLIYVHTQTHTHTLFLPLARAEERDLARSSRSVFVPSSLTSYVIKRTLSFETRVQMCLLIRRECERWTVWTLNEEDEKKEWTRKKKIWENVVVGGLERILVVS